MEQRLEFESEGETMVGTLFRPDGADGPLPVVVAAGGWCYTKEIVIPHVARIAGAEGVQFFGFDYRGFGESGGARRQHLDPWMQISDFRNAITFAERMDEADETAMGVFGISYSGGHSLILSAIEPRVRAFVSVVPVVHGYETVRRVHGEVAFRRFEQELLQDRRARFSGEGGTMPMSSPMDKVSASDPLSVWPAPHVYDVFQQVQATEAPLHQHWNTVESAELLLNYSVFPYLPRTIEKPVLIIVAEGDNITSIDLEVEAYNKIPSPYKELKILRNVSHMSIYSDRRDTNLAGAAAADFYAKHLVSPVPAAA